MNKNILKSDFNSISDMANGIKAFHSNPHTEIIAKNPYTGEVLFKAENKVIAAGGDFVARHLFDLYDKPIVFPTYNDELAIPDPGPEDPGAIYDFTAATRRDPKVLLFCLGDDGCGTEGSQIFQVDYNSRISPDHLLPFRYPMAGADISEETQKMYAGRKVDGEFVAYPFKRFTAGPKLFQQYLDGTPIEGNVYSTKQEFEIYVETVLTITRDEVREFYIATSGIDRCLFNTFSLCSAYPRMVNGKVHYMGIRPFTKLNISNEYLTDPTKGVEITYRTYF